MAHFEGTNAAEVLPTLLLSPILALGNDTADGNGGNDALLGWTGDDVLQGGAGSDLIVGGLLILTGGLLSLQVSGLDTASYVESSAGVDVDLSLLLNVNINLLGLNLGVTLATVGSGGDAEGDMLLGMTHLTGSAFDDFLGGTVAANTLIGGDGNDILRGAGGGDTLTGGNGTDMVDYFTSGSGVTVNLATNAVSGGDAAGDTITGFEWIRGSEFVDNLTGSAAGNMISGEDGNDVIDGAAGNDALFGEGGTDTLNGGDGTDRLVGGAGADTLIGGNGTDTAYYDDALVGVTVNLADTSANTGDAAGDTYSGIEHFAGSAFDDIMIGDGGNNLLSGWDGADDLSGGAGKDQLFGGTGADTITGGAGADTLRGAGDADTFVYTAASDSGVGHTNADLIADFASGDRIDLSAVITGEGTFIGTAQFGHIAGQVRAVSAGGQTGIFVDVDGNGAADMQIRLSGALTLAASDFVL